ncbi:MAG: ribosomal protein [Rickettsiaceae bacterium]|jgi:large subunit ribosomal protein L13|nr:ribosomal protein [Rickettsiaceae bacterium]
MTTYSAKPSEIERKWYIIDATDLVLGRLAAKVSMVLRGKHKPLFSTNIDCGDHVIIINAEKVHLTGNKLLDKQYFRHTGHPGGIKETNPAKIFSGKNPGKVVEKAVERMIARSPLGRAQMLKLHVYAGEEHPHAGQKPEVLKFAEENRKNKKSEAA